MPNRIIRESINESAGLALVSPFAQDLFKRLITYADDYGRFNSNLAIIRARLYALELDAVTVNDIDDGIVELVGVAKIRLYQKTDHRGVFGYFPKWDQHQRIRHTRAKCPDPETENINDWALKRFVPIALKRIIFERDKFKCQTCAHSFRLVGIPVAEAVRILSGVLHIDHIVPVSQGGRATEENLRLLCRACNLTRPRMFDWTGDAHTSPFSLPNCQNGRKLPQVAADFLTLPPESNPIRIQSNPNPIQPPKGDDGFDLFWKSYPKKKSKGDAEKAWKALKPTKDLLSIILTALERAKVSPDWTKDGGQFIPFPATWLRRKGWEDEEFTPLAPRPDPSYDITPTFTDEEAADMCIHGEFRSPSFRVKHGEPADKICGACAWEAKKAAEKGATA